ncbi:RNA 3'-terminal phosphate cyclase isoform X2 [Orussus abietinus]|nr:RNA 3'-terminal phosphate cyclase isoform X2 [Orussus abietinus]
MCSAQVSGAYIGSTKLEFRPGPLQNFRRELIADIQTAGCICLLAQVAIPCALFSPSTDPVTLILKGGTNVPMGPPIEYLTEVLKPILNKFGADFNFTVVRRGYYPKGGGEVHLYIKPVRSLNSVNLLDPGEPVNVSGWSYVAGSVNIAEANKMASDAKRTLIDGFVKNNIPVPSINIESYREDRNMAIGNGSGINIVCNTSNDHVFGGSGLGSGRREDIAPGIIAATQVLNPILKGSCVDEHSQDQIIIFMALAQGISRVQIGEKNLTCHTETAIQVAELMLGSRGLKFSVTKGGNEGEFAPYILECHGCGLVNNSLL